MLEHVLGRTDVDRFLQFCAKFSTIDQVQSKACLVGTMTHTALRPAVKSFEIAL
jgi:hypothetical protein